MERNEPKNIDAREEIYQNAQILIDGGLYTQAADAFARIPGYRDADQRKTACEEKAEEQRKDRIYDEADKAASNPNVKSQQKAIRIFSEISGWRDADERIAEANRRIGEIVAKEKADRQEAIRAAAALREKRAKRRKKIIRIAVASTAALILCLIGVFLFRKYAVPAIRYNRAVALMDAGDDDGAYRILHGMDYRDSDELVFRISKDRLKDAEVGSTVLFGAYPQGKAGSAKKDPVEWIVLEKDGSKLLLISKYALDCLPYQRFGEATDTVTWRDSLLREWLNDGFLDSAFDRGEQRMLMRTLVKEDRGDNANPLQNAADRVFLLSVQEAQTYFPSDEQRRCHATPFAVGYGAYRSSIGGTCIWWLRTPQEPIIREDLVDAYAVSRQRVACVGTSGEIIEIGHDIHNGGYAVRPVIWVDAERTFSNALPLFK